MARLHNRQKLVLGDGLTVLRVNSEKLKDTVCDGIDEEDNGRHQPGVEGDDRCIGHGNAVAVKRGYGLRQNFPEQNDNEGQNAGGHRKVGVAPETLRKQRRESGRRYINNVVAD